MGMQMKKEKKRKLLPAMLAIALAAALVAPMGSGAALAAEGDGTITLNVQDGTDEYGTFGEDLKEKNDDGTGKYAQVAFYQIASGTKDTSYDTYNWSLNNLFKTDEMEELLKRAEKGAKTEDDKDAYEELAQKALEIIVRSKQKPEPAATKIFGEKSETLGAGFYLAVPMQAVTGGDGAVSYEAIMNADGQITVTTKNFIYIFQPMLISVPTKDPKDGSRGTAYNYGPWITDVTMTTKAGRVPNVGSIEIRKELSRAESKAEAATFVFSVKATWGTGDARRTVYDNVVSISYPGLKPVRIDNLPVGSEVTIEEIYTSPSYSQKGKTPAENIIIDAEPDDEEVTQYVIFTNDYNDNHYHGGGGIENQYANTDNEKSSGKSWKFIGRIINGVVSMDSNTNQAEE